jgi:tetratricopeptide (TPR) repeat protein
MKNLIFITILVGLLAACNDSSTKANENKQAVNKSATVKELSIEIENTPTNPELYYRRAIAYSQEDELALALADIDQALILNPENALYHYRRGKICFFMNKTIEAAKSLEKSIEINPSFIDAKIELADLYLIVKEHRKSNDLLNTVLAQDAQNAEAFFLKGMNYKELGDTAMAAQAFQKAYDLDNKHFDAVMQLGNLYASANNKTALDYYIAASRINAKSEEPPYNAGVFLQQKGDYKKAIQMYQQALKANPEHYPSYYNAALINMDVKRYDDAITNLKAVIRIEPRMIDAYYQIGVCYENIKAYEDARINFEAVLDMNPAHKEAAQHLKRLK